MQLIAKKGVKIYRDYYIDMEIKPPFIPKEGKVPLAQKEDIEVINFAPRKRVEKFDLLATLKNGVFLYSPFSGTVKSVSSAPKMGRRKDILYLEIDVIDDNKPSFPLWEVTSNPGRDVFLDIIKKAGILDECSGKFLTDLINLSKKYNTLLVDAVDEQPYDLSKTSTFLQSKNEVYLGAEIISKALNIPDTKFLLNKNFRTFTALKNKDNSFKGEFVKVGGKYPFSPVIDEFTKDTKGLKIGVQCCKAVYRAFYFGEPQISLNYTVWGEGVNNPCNLEVYFGTPVGEILNHCGAFGVLERVVLGGIMQGYTASSSWPPVVGDSSITVMPFKKHHKTTQCISCGRCSMVCPLGLAPYYAVRQSERNSEVKINKLTAEICIHCGNCSYICPARIPLEDYINKF